MSSSAQANTSDANNTAAQAMRGLVRIIATFVVLMVVYVFYSSYQNTSRQLDALRKAATDLIKHDMPADYRAAAKKLDDGLALRDDPWFVATRAEVGAILWADGETAQQSYAQKYVAHAIELKLNTAQRFDAEALSMIAAGNINEAGDKLIDVVSRSAGSAALLADLGMVHQRQGKIDGAKNDFKQATDRDSLNPRFGALYGDAQFDNGEYQNAQSAFQRALDGNTNHLRSLIGKARADIAVGEHVAEAVKTFNEAIATPDALTPVLKARALVGLAEAQLAAGDVAKAEGAARQAIESKVDGDASVAYSHYILGLALAAQKKPGALTEFKSAITTVAYIPRFYFQGATALAKQGASSDGAVLLSQYAAHITGADGKMKVDDAYHRAKGEFLTISGKLDDAIKEYDTAIADNNINPDTYYRKGMVYEQQAKDASKADAKKISAQAFDMFEKAISFRERFPDAYREEGLLIMAINPKDPKVMEKFTKALIYYKEAKAPKAVTDDFINTVSAKYDKLGKPFKKVSADWKKEAADALKP